MVVWPFPIRQPFSESLEWLTDVHRTKNYEQRFAIRIAPLTRFTFDHYLTTPDYVLAQILIKENDSFLVPDWPLSVDAGVVSAGASVFLDYGLPYSQITIGDYILVWQSSTHYEACEVLDTDSADGFYADVTKNFDKAKLIPLRRGQSAGGFAGVRRAGNFLSADITFELTENVDIGASTYSVFLGHDIITECPVIGSSEFAEPLSYPVSTFDGDVGPAVLLKTRNFYDYKKNMRWLTTTREETYRLRQFLHSRRGRQKAFWLPSYGKEIKLVQNTSPSQTLLFVDNPHRLDNFDLTFPYIYINNSHVREIESYAVTELNGQPIFQIQIDVAVGEILTTETSIHFLQLMRFDSDRIELSHQARNRVSVAIPTIELNEL